MLRYLFRRPGTIRVPTQNGQFDIQKVSVKKSSRTSISRFTTTILISFCVARTADHVFYDRDLKKGWKRLQSKEWWAAHFQQAKPQTPSNAAVPPQSGAPEPATIHLMFPIWVRRKQRGWYAEDDPQWKAFQQFAQDRKRLREVKVKIATLIQEQLATERFIPWINHLQPKELNLDLEVIIPIAPPAFYEVPCIFIQPSGQIVYGWRQLPDGVGSKVDRVFHPIMLTKAFYAGFCGFAKITYEITKARLADRWNDYQARASPKEGSNPAESMPQPVGDLTEEEKLNRRIPAMRLSDQYMKRTLPFLRGEYGEHESRQAYRDLVRSMTYRAAIDTGCAVFRQRWVSGQARELQRPALDVITFKGTCQFVGDKGKLYLEVLAYYDVATQTLIGRPVIGGAFIIPHAKNWHGNKSGSAVAAMSKAADPKKDAVKASVKRPEPPRETTSETSSPVKDEED